MTKYAPARDDGLKPWVAEITEWGRTRTRIVWAENASQARYDAKNRQRYVTVYVRRATSNELVDSGETP